jgi:excisionase family DNA binding protein
MNVEAFVEALGHMVRVGQAAKQIGVSKETLRNWDKSGRLVATRHPVTGYRYYRQIDLDEFLRSVTTEQKKVDV